MTKYYIVDEMKKEVLCYEAGQYDAYFTPDFNDPHILYFESEEEAKEEYETYQSIFGSGITLKAMKI